ncbi:MAG TPA: hypothetical protein VN426_09185 [Syntrophomonadaceae bacterium]|nr:hypothetical protein [Syntrophomonadaceae bacterium]
MKSYIKPILSAVDIRAEERFALTSPCMVTGSCTPDEVAEWKKSGIIALN